MLFMKNIKKRIRSASGVYSDANWQCRVSNSRALPSFSRGRNWCGTQPTPSHVLKPSHNLAWSWTHTSSPPTFTKTITCFITPSIANNCSQANHHWYGTSYTCRTINESNIQLSLVLRVLEYKERGMVEQLATSDVATCSIKLCGKIGKWWRHQWH